MKQLDEEVKYVMMRMQAKVLGKVGAGRGMRLSCMVCFTE
jgi:hypothetical protein